MIEYVYLLLLLTMFGSITFGCCYVYYRLKKIFYLISIVMDSEILDQLTNLGRDVNSEFPKPKRGRKKKADTKINELEDNDVRDKRERLVGCILSGNLLRSLLRCGKAPPPSSPLVSILIFHHHPLLVLLYIRFTQSRRSVVPWQKINPRKCTVTTYQGMG